MHPDTTVSVRYRPPEGSPRRVTFDPRSDGRWTRTTDVWTDGAWREQETEIVADLAVTVSHPRARVYRGP